MDFGKLISIILNLKNMNEREISALIELNQVVAEMEKLRMKLY